MPNASPWTLAAVVAGGGVGAMLLLLLAFPPSSVFPIGVALTAMFSVNVFAWRRKQLRQPPDSN